jgi:hypothetical protein
VRVSGSELWLSEAKLITAQPLSRAHVLLVARAEAGEAFVHGLEGNSGVQHAVLTTTANARALRRCPQWQDSLRARADGALVVTSAATSLAALERCGFDRLAAEHSEALESELRTLAPSLQSAGLSLAQVAPQEGRLVWNLGASQIAKAKARLGALAPFSTLRSHGVPLESTIEFKIDLFEFSRSSATALGLEGVAKARDGFSIAREGSGMNLTALYSQAHQSGRLLASPRLRTVPGKVAEFNSGGEIPVQDAQAFGAKTSWKAYGLKILLTPRSDASPLGEEIATTIDIEYSQPDYGNGMGGVPAMIRRDLKSEFHLPMSQTTLLTSMVQVRRGGSSEGGLGLGALPLLGSLFHSRSDREDQSEIWFFITPRWSTPIDAGEITRPWKRYGKNP